MEKFLKICWKEDVFSGEANFNIDNNFEKDTLFYSQHNTIKKNKIKELIEENILKRNITDNITGLKSVLKMGGEPLLFTEVVKS